ncbi:MAG: hypothetical protein MUE50_25170 [Pirellulaceae bacterium]|jgi:hypothetical protein|nr:hypothetical protein [Pirellulaceae bacterium]
MKSKPTPDLAMPHHYQLTIDNSKLAPGEHTLAARVTWPDGTVVQELRGWAVACPRHEHQVAWGGSLH